MSLNQIRSQIDAIDTEIVKLLAARQSLVKQAAAFKADEQAVRAPARRAAIMQHRRELALSEGVSPEVVRRVFETVIDAFIELELHEHNDKNRHACQ